MKIEPKSRNGTNCSIHNTNKVTAWQFYKPQPNNYWFYCNICSISADRQLSELPEEIKLIRNRALMNKEEGDEW